MLEYTDKGIIRAGLELIAQRLPWDVLSWDRI